MTTPQNQLYNLSCYINDLTKLFEKGEDEQDIFENVKQIYITVQMLDERMERIENQMALIIKLLAKSHD